MEEKALKALDDAIHWLESYRYFMTHQYEHRVLGIEGGQPICERKWEMGYAPHPCQGMKRWLTKLNTTAPTAGGMS